MYDLGPVLEQPLVRTYSYLTLCLSLPSIAMPFTFNLTADAPKRPSADAEQSVAKKPRFSTPSAASLVVMDSIKKPDRPQRLPTAADLVVCITKVTDKAGDLWENFQNTNCSLWQIQAASHARVRP